MIKKQYIFYKLKQYGDYIPWVFLFLFKRTALQLASAFGKTISVSFLLEKGANKSIRDKTGRNAKKCKKIL